MDDAIREFSFAKPSCVMGHILVMLYKYGMSTSDFLGFFIHFLEFIFYIFLLQCKHIEFLKCAQKTCVLVQ